MRGIDLTGQRFGRLIVIERSGSNKHGNSLWKCICDHGGIGKPKETITTSRNLKVGYTKSCGCLQKEKASKKGKGTLIDLIGQRFGYLTVIERIRIKNRSGTYWKCVCDHGGIGKPKETIVLGNSLKSEKTKSCGCYNLEKIKKYKTTEEAFLGRVLNNYKKRARKRNLIFDLSLEKFVDLIYGKCYYCGSMKYSNSMPIRDKIFYYNGIDRIDNSKGYIEGNVVSCCVFCNSAKYKHTLKDFNEWLDQIVKYRTEQYKQPKGHMGKYTQMGNVFCGYHN